MLDGRSRVTVVGARKRVDVALPSAAPIGEYSAGLASLCGQERPGALPPAWSLALAGSAPLPLHASLADSGVSDGQLLYLRDLARDPGTEPAVADAEELIAGEAEDQRRRGLPRALVVMSFGLAWLAATAGFVWWRHGPALIPTAVTLIAAGLLLIGTGWALAQRRTLAPAPLCVLASLTSVPCLAAAGALLAQAVAGHSMWWVGVICGANAAVLMSLAATPEAVVILVGLQLAVALLIAPLLVAVHANGVQAAAATVVATLSMLGLAKLAAALVTVWSQRLPRDDRALAHAATAMLVRTRRLLAVLVAGPALALSVALPVLALSRNGFGLALAGVASVALLVRAQQAGFTGELLPVGGAGLVGLFAVLVAVAEKIWTAWLAVTLVLTVAGLVLVACGVVGAIRRPGGEPVPDMPAGFPPGAGRPDRRRFVDIIGMLCVVASVSLALGVFGVFHELMGMGRAMVGG
jgi:WXG100 protein secretion system (Wss), protein YukD